MKKNGGVSL